MKKIRCPRCGAINLEAFVTFPHCAGCNALLPQSEEVAPLSAWRRPLRVWLWTALLGGAAGLLIALAASYQASPAPLRGILLYGQMPRRATLGQIIDCRVTIDSVSPPGARADADLEDVALRLPRALERRFVVLQVSPAPHTISVSGSASGGGRYFHFGRLPRETPVRLRLRAVRAGRHRVSIGVSAREHEPGQWSGNILIAAR